MKIIYRINGNNYSRKLFYKRLKQDCWRHPNDVGGWERKYAEIRKELATQSVCVARNKTYSNKYEIVRKAI